MMVKDIIAPIADLIGRFIPDPNKKAELLAELQKHPHLERLAQIDVNRESAKHTSLWVAGARPAVIWWSLGMLTWGFVVYPLIKMGLSMAGYDPNILPDLPLQGILTMLGGILGINHIARSFEKWKGVARSNLSEPEKAPPKE